MRTDIPAQKKNFDSNTSAALKMIKMSTAEWKCVLCTIYAVMKRKLGHIANIGS